MDLTTFKRIVTLADNTLHMWAVQTEAEQDINWTLNLWCQHEANYFFNVVNLLKIISNNIAEKTYWRKWERQMSAIAVWLFKQK